MIRTIPALLVALPAVGCGLFVGNGGDAITGQACVTRERGTINTGPLPDGCIKTEGGDLGQLQTLSFGGSTIEFTGWTSKNDSGEGEYVGFTYVATAGTFLSIKAGGESHLEDGDGTWTHPAGVSGPEASAISNIVMCEDAPDENDPGGEDGAGSGGDGDGDGDGDCIPPGENDTDGDGEPDPTDDDDDGIPDAQDPSPNGGPDPANGDQCTVNADCGSGVCTNGVCVDV